MSLVIFVTPVSYSDQPSAHLSVLHTDAFWYRMNGMGAQKNPPKKVLVLLFPYIFQVKTK